jgi:hypothetical protein
MKHSQWQRKSLKPWKQPTNEESSTVIDAADVRIDIEQALAEPAAMQSSTPVRQARLASIVSLTIAAALIAVLGIPAIRHLSTPFRKYDHVSGEPNDLTNTQFPILNSHPMRIGNWELGIGQILPTSFLAWHRLIR